jgi:O-antigen/teichoic acid export membrane protein
MSLFEALNARMGSVEPLRYLKSAFWLSSAKIASVLVSLAATFYIARTLGPQNFGELSYAQSIIGIVAVTSALTAALYRDVVRTKENEPVLLGTAWTLSFGSAFLTSLLALGFVYLTPHDDLAMWVIGILCLAQFFSPFYSITNVFYAKTETRLLSIINFSIHVLISFLKVWAMVVGHGVLILAVIMVLEQAVTALAYVLLYVRTHHGSIAAWRFDATYARRLMIDSLPLAIIAASGIISGRIDQVFLKQYLDTTAVGLYSVAVQLSEMWQFLPGILLTAVFPAIMNVTISPIAYRNRMLALGTTLLGYGVLLSCILTYGAPFIVTTLYGVHFTDSSALLAIYSWSITGMVLGFLMSYILLSKNMRRVQLISGVVPMLVNVVLNSILIPRAGAQGAALATVISYSLMPLIPFAYKEVRALFILRP